MERDAAGHGDQEPGGGGWKGQSWSWEVDRNWGIGEEGETSGPPNGRRTGLSGWLGAVGP